MWSKELDAARHAAREAGKTLKNLFGRVSHVAKKGKTDLVTEADFEAEKIIMDIIHKSFPQDGFVAEESGEHSPSASRMWFIDPLDGTLNFAHAFPFFAVSIGLQVDGDAVLGVVFNPYMDEFFEAAKGSGASLNGEPIHVSSTSDLVDSLLAVGFPYTLHQNPHRVMDHLKKMAVRAQAIRRPGSAALDLCYVAAGRLDGYWEEGLKPWDTAGGMIIVREAGGIVSDYEGNPFSPDKGTIVASNPLIHAAMLEVLKS
jgi:myo-inositol-1(or 4)-monophosphatase